MSFRYFLIDVVVALCALEVRTVTHQISSTVCEYFYSMNCTTYSFTYFEHFFEAKCSILKKSTAEVQKILVGTYGTNDQKERKNVLNQ